MYCRKCGKEIVEKYKFCKYCGSEIIYINNQLKEENIRKETQNVTKNNLQSSAVKLRDDITNKTVNVENTNKKTRKYAIPIIAALFFVVIIGVVIRGNIAKYKESKTKTESEYEALQKNNYKESEDNDVYNEETESKDDIYTDEINDNDDSSEISKIEKGVLDIREVYNEIVSNIESKKYKKISIRYGGDYYYDKSGIKAIIISKGIDGSEYSCSFYYSDNSLIFAYYENKDSHRLYFQEDRMFRWRRTKDITKPSDVVDMDQKRNDQKYLEWEKRALSDSDKYINDFNEIAEIDDSNIKKIYASSELSEYSMTHSVGRLCDGSLSNAWVEGAPDQGINEYIGFKFDDNYKIRGIKINAGYQKSEELYYKNSRPNKVRISFSDGTNKIVCLDDIYGEQNIEFDDIIIAKSVKLTIKSVYKGNKYKDTVISELSFY